MNKEEILQKSRNENKNRDVYELEIINKSSNYAMRAGLLTACIMCVISAFLIDGDVWILCAMPCWSVYFSMLATLFLYKYIKMKKRHELALSIIYFSVCAFMILRFVLYAVGMWV